MPQHILFINQYVTQMGIDLISPFLNKICLHQSACYTNLYNLCESIRDICNLFLTLKCLVLHNYLNLMKSSWFEDSPRSNSDFN